MMVQHISAQQPYTSGMETIVFKGILFANLHFELLGSQSAQVIRQWPKVNDRTYFIELHDKEGKTLSREPVAVTDPVICHDAINPFYQVHGCIALRERAVKVLFFKEDILIAEFLLGDPPSLALNWNVKRVSRGKKYALEVQFSKPVLEAHMQVLYQWDNRRYRAIGLFDPTQRIELDFSQLPGGDACRLHVAYTSGLRTSVAVTDAFFVSNLKPSISLITPRDNATYAPWHPIDLHAEVYDEQNGSVSDESVDWLLDGKIICHGRRGCLPSVPSEGKYEIALQYHGKEIIKHTIRVRKPSK